MKKEQISKIEKIFIGNFELHVTNYNGRENFHGDTYTPSGMRMEKGKDPNEGICGESILRNQQSVVRK